MKEYIQKHAYLIIAHNEFKILKLLLEAIDDERNDIYIHFDKKVKEIPSVGCRYANLSILENRIDVRWGDFSQIEAELELFRQAYNKGNYLYYHLISGVDIPIKSQDYIHNFFRFNAGKEFIGFYQGDAKLELRKKVGIYHIFSKSFSKDYVRTFKSISRAIISHLQLYIGVKRNKDISVVRGTNWVSITNDFVGYILTKEKDIKRRYHHTFCADEVYKHTLCWNSPFKDALFDATSEANGCMRFINWIITPEKSYLPSFTMGNYSKLKESTALFARKFDEENIDVVKLLVSDIKKHENFKG